MSTNYQAARIALGVRLRELRAEAGLSGRRIAGVLQWPPSKISKLENGRQTPTVADLSAWAEAVNRPEAKTELSARLRALETHYASWRRQLAAGTRANQEAWTIDEQKCTEFLNFEPSCIPGLLQTPDYARHMLALVTEIYEAPNDVEDGVQARTRRLRILYEPGRSFQFLIWEAALRVTICPPDTMAAQLDRLAGLIGMNSIKVGIVPLDAELRIPPFHAFVIYDRRLVRVETLGAELRIVDASEVANYGEVWSRLDESAVYGHRAHRIIARARASSQASSHDEV